MAISVRTRFEVFKRDEFTCRYCGRKSPEVVLEADHIVPSCDGGSDDAMNLATSCWECNHGKSGVPLAAVMTGEDPHDKAVLVLEQERQLREYNAVVAAARERIENTAWELYGYWHAELCPCADIGGKGCSGGLSTVDFRWLKGAVRYCPSEVIKDFMDSAFNRGATWNLKYVGGCVRNWRDERIASEDSNRRDGDDVDS